MNALLSLDTALLGGAVALGIVISAAILIPALLWSKHRTVKNLRVKLSQHLPMTLEQIDADKEVIKAHHLIELRRLELKLAEVQAAEAEANARAQEGLNRIDKLNRRIEVLQLKLAGRAARKEIRKIDAQLIELDDMRAAHEDAA